MTSKEYICGSTSCGWKGTRPRLFRKDDEEHVLSLEEAEGCADDELDAFCPSCGRNCFSPEPVMPHHITAMGPTYTKEGEYAGLTTTINLGSNQADTDKVLEACKKLLTKKRELQPVDAGIDLMISEWNVVLIHDAQNDLQYVLARPGCVRQSSDNGVEIFELLVEPQEEVPTS